MKLSVFMCLLCFSFAGVFHVLYYFVQICYAFRFVLSLFDFHISLTVALVFILLWRAISNFISSCYSPSFQRLPLFYMLGFVGYHFFDMLFALLLTFAFVFVFFFLALRAISYLICH